MSKPYWENVPQAENLSDEVKQRIQIILSMTIPYLLANGRPPEALEAPDILHLLLLRQQQAHDLTHGDDLFDSDFDDDEDDDEGNNNNNNKNNEHHRYRPEWSVIDADNWIEIEPEENTSPLSINQIMNEAENVCNVTDPLLPHEVNTFSEQGNNYDSPWSDPAHESTTVEELGIRTETREMRKAAAVARRIKEAQVPQHRRRKTAEEVYGLGAEYTLNPLNGELDIDNNTMIVKRKDSTCTHQSDNAHVKTSNNRSNKLSIGLPTNCNITNNNSSSKNYLVNATTNATEVIVESGQVNDKLEMPPPSQHDSNPSQRSLIYSSPSSSIADKRLDAQSSDRNTNRSNAEGNKC